MMRTKSSILALLFASFSLPALAQVSNNESIDDYFSTWQLVSFENAFETGPSYSYVTEEMARQQIGKQLILSSGKVAMDKGLLWSESIVCKAPRYERVEPDEFIGPGWIFLLPLEHTLKRSGDLLFIQAICKEKVFFSFEVTKDDKLSVFYDGYYFIFQRHQLPNIVQ